MKRFLSFCLVLGLGMALGQIFDGVGRMADAGGGTVASTNGDVNGDGRLDLADGIYILNHQFMGGPPPVPIECPPGRKGLPETGQTLCYGPVANEGWVPVPCEASCAGQDGFYATGCGADGSGRFSDFSDNGDGTVSDKCTGLMWQKDTGDTNGDGLINSLDALPWCEALTYCENLSFAGHDDWRLPNVRELQSLVDYGRFGPSINPLFAVPRAAPGVSSAFYWSSTSFAERPFIKWNVDFFYGDVDEDSVAGLYYVRAVRSGP